MRDIFWLIRQCRKTAQAKTVQLSWSKRWDVWLSRALIDLCTHTHIYPYRHSQCLMYPKIGYGIFPKQMIVDWRVKNQFRIMNDYTPIWSCHPLRIRARRAELEARAPPVPTPSRSGRTIYVLSINTKIGVFSFLHIKNPINYIMRSMSSISQSR